MLQFYPLQKNYPSTVALGVELDGTCPALLSTQLCVPALCGGGLVQGVQEKGVWDVGVFQLQLSEVLCPGYTTQLP